MLSFKPFMPRGESALPRFFPWIQTQKNEVGSCVGERKRSKRDLNNNKSGHVPLSTCNMQGSGIPLETAFMVRKSRSSTSMIEMQDQKKDENYFVRERAMKKILTTNGTYFQLKKHRIFNSNFFTWTMVFTWCILFQLFTRQWCEIWR